VTVRRQPHAPPAAGAILRCTMRTPSLAISQLAFLGWFLGCGTTEPPMGGVALIEVSPSSATAAALGETQNFGAVAKDASGNTISGLTFAWSSSAPAVATVDSRGVVTAVGNGTATVTAGTGGVSGSAAMTVSQVVVAVQPEAEVGLTALGATHQFSVEATDSRGHPVTGQTFTWVSSDTDVATIDATGLATAVGNGSATITATTGGISGSVTLTVSQTPVGVVVTPGIDTLSALGDTVRFGASARDANDRVIVGQSFTWSSSIPAVAMVDDDGVATALDNGSVTITATLADLSSSASLTVRQVTAAVTVTPDAYTLTVIGDTLRLGGLAKDGNDSTIVGASLHWSSSAPDVAAVDETGLVTAIGPGYATISAEADGVPGTAALTVEVFAAVSAGDLHTCAITTEGAAYCWGSNAYGQVGDGTTTPRMTPVVVEGGLHFVAVSAGTRHTCGVTTDGAAYCWGHNANGTLGASTSEKCANNVPCSTSPVAVSGGLTFSSISAASTSTCGVTPSGDAYCWGNNLSGQLGDGTTTSRSAPTAVAGGLEFTSVSAGYQHTCGVTTGGDAHCWGSNGGALGDGTQTDSPIPVLVAGELQFASVSASERQTCGLTTDGVSYCWGSNNFSNFGDGTNTGSLSPVPTSGGLRFAALIARYQFTCGMASDGVGYCWGSNPVGQLGTGGSTTYTTSTPAAVAGGLSFVSIGAGNLEGDYNNGHGCGVVTDGLLYCWGANGSGQIGDGTTTNRMTPVRVAR
jgi:alpha-tubulin suppressor-like RCC1 family protein